MKGIDMSKARFRRSSTALVGVATLVVTGVATGFAATPAAASGSPAATSGIANSYSPALGHSYSRDARQPGVAVKRVTSPRPGPGYRSPAAGSGPLVSHGGPVQTAPRVYLDFWGWTADPNGEAAYLQNFLTKVGGTPWLDTVNQYSGAGAAVPLSGTWSDPAAVPTAPTDAQIQSEASAAVSHFGLSTGDGNIQIVVATPTGHSTAGFGSSFCAYHGVIGATSNSYTDLPYIPDAGTACGSGSVNPGSTLDGVSIVEGHELAEAITDPQLNAWYDSTGNEIADKCAWTGLGNLDLNGTNFAMQPLWSNATNSCVMSTAAPTLPAPPDDQRLTGDFNGDGKADVAVVYNDANLQTRMYVLTSTGSAFNAPVIWYDSGPNAWDWTQTKAVVGDFNGDGKSDIGILYNYGSSNTGFNVMLSTGTAFTVHNWYLSGAGNWDWNASKPVAGDFNGDGKADIGVLYNVGTLNTNLDVLTSTGSSFNAPQVWYASGAGNWDWNASKPVAGDFTGDGKTDVGVLYNYGSSNTGFNVLISTGTAFTVHNWYLSGVGNWDWNASKPVAGDFNGDGKADFGVVYNVGTLNTNLDVLTSTGSSFNAPQVWYASGAGNWDWNATKPFTGDFNGDGKTDLGALYNYGNATTGFNAMISTGTAFTIHNWYLDNNWDWYRSMPA
jgi:hypothetical protein